VLCAAERSGSITSAAAPLLKAIKHFTETVMMAALDARQRFQFSYWDAAIIEASRALGCTHVLSEDLSDGQDYGGVQVTNPFAKQ
jgi:predicted nucleic acid-binding protein